MSDNWQNMNTMQKKKLLSLFAELLSIAVGTHSAISPTFILLFLEGELNICLLL